jgi:hypothetical protein
VKGGIKELRWPGTLMALGIILTMFDLVTVARWTLLQPTTLLRIQAGLCFAVAVVPYRRLAWKVGMERLEWFLFNLLGLGPLLMALLLWTNFLFTGPGTTTVHRVAEMECGRHFCTLRFVGDKWADYPQARTVPRESQRTIGHSARITEAVGLFGIPVVVRLERAR